MPKTKRLTALLLVLALTAALCGCGQTTEGGFRVLETVGKRHYNLICRLDDRIAPLLDEAMNELAASGELSAISARWLGRDAITLKGETPPRESDTPEEAEPTESRRLIFGVEAEFRPLAYTDAGVLRGMSIDIADALGRVLGWEVAYQPINPSEVSTQLSSGNIDCALGFDPATVRADKYTVGVNYMDSEVLVAVRGDSSVKSLRDVKGQRLGTISDPVLTGLLAESEAVTRSSSGATVYLSPRRCLNALDKGWCAAVAMDRIMLEHLV